VRRLPLGAVGTLKKLYVDALGASGMWLAARGAQA
jgi:hypothetical protein